MLLKIDIIVFGNCHKVKTAKAQPQLVKKLKIWIKTSNIKIILIKKSK